MDNQLEDIVIRYNRLKLSYDNLFSENEKLETLRDDLKREIGVCQCMVNRMANEWGKTLGLENYQIAQRLDQMADEERKKYKSLESK